ncbi:MAG: GNAT family N-acetyltransferase [Asticcacaulis sp.]
MMYEANGITGAEMNGQGVIRVRDYNPDDIDTLMRLFQAAVAAIPQTDYTSDQLRAWASQRLDRDAWLIRRASKPTFVAQIDDEIAGFSDLTDAGYIDMMFVHPQYQGKGVARALFARIMDVAQRKAIRMLETDASITARPFFKSCGFETLSSQEVAIGGQVLRNYRMRLSL